MKKILIAPNSYKECASSVKAAELFKKYINVFDVDLIIAPLSDGGDGFLEVCTNRYSLELINFPASSPTGVNFEVSTGYDRKNENIYIESADIVGLKLIESDKRNPMKYDSSGLGKLIKEINTSLNVKKFIIGIGGTATNDLGLGMLSNLGLNLYNKRGEIIYPVPENYSEIFDAEWKSLIDKSFEIIVDVDNPLLGEKGSASVYGPQKGLSRKNINYLNTEFERLTNLFKKKKYSSKQNLSGAGGGLAAGFQIFLNAEVKTSKDFILKDLGLNDYLNNADIIITGEGSFDEQSRYGKASGIVINNSHQTVYLVCGKISDTIKLPGNVVPIELLKYFNDTQESIKYFEKGIESAAKEIIVHIKNNFS